jgi:hypothetical protein
MKSAPQTIIRAPNTNTIVERLSIFSVTSTSGGDYFHFKTNVPKQSDVMMCLEFVGFNFNAGSKPIRSMASFYTYGGTSHVYQPAMSNCYSGMTLQSIYYTADNYTAVSGLASHYYTGITVNAYPCNPTASNYNIQILAFAQLTTTGNAW